jgi:hypothetical protein
MELITHTGIQLSCCVTAAPESSTSPLSTDGFKISPLRGIMPEHGRHQLLFLPGGEAARKFVYGLMFKPFRIYFNDRPRIFRAEEYIFKINFNFCY